MASMNKMRKRYEAEKMAKEVMNAPAFKEAMKKQQEQSVLNALARFVFMMCGYLETRHGYKKDGLKRFLAFVLLNLECTGDDEKFFVKYDKYYKDEYGLDVLEALGLGLE